MKYIFLICFFLLFASILFAQTEKYICVFRSAKLSTESYWPKASDCLINISWNSIFNEIIIYQEEPLKIIYDKLITTNYNEYAEYTSTAIDSDKNKLTITIKKFKKVKRIVIDLNYSAISYTYMCDPK